MITFIAFLIFSGALFAAGYYVWTVPQKQENEVLVARLREIDALGHPAGGDVRRDAVELLADLVATHADGAGRHVEHRVCAVEVGHAGHAAACPTGAVAAPHQTREQIGAELQALLAPGGSA